MADADVLVYSTPFTKGDSRAYADESQILGIRSTLSTLSYKRHEHRITCIYMHNMMHIVDLMYAPLYNSLKYIAFQDPRYHIWLLRVFPARTQECRATDH
jgi:hypothetical protein